MRWSCTRRVDAGLSTMLGRRRARSTSSAPILATVHQSTFSRLADRHGWSSMAARHQSHDA